MKPAFSALKCVPIYDATMLRMLPKQLRHNFVEDACIVVEGKEMTSGLLRLKENKAKARVTKFKRIMTKMLFPQRPE